MRPLRILHSEAATSFGGQEHYILRLMKAMRERGHHLEAVCQPHAQLTQRLRAEGFTVHTLLMDGPVNFLKGVHAIRRILRLGQFDVLNSHSRRDTVLAGTAARIAGTPLIVRTRHLAKPVGSLFSYTRIPHCVFTPSRYVRDHLISKGVAPEKVAVVYPCVDIKELGGPSTLRNELGLAKTDIIVVCVAVMRTEKGQKALIDAMVPLLRQRQDLHLVFAGGGAPLLEQLETYAAQLELKRCVHFLGSRGDIPSILAGSDIFALATRMEASGTAFLEAGAMGLPTVGTQVGGVPEMLQNGRTGLLVPLDDTPALTRAISSLVESPETRKAMGQAGKVFCLESGNFLPSDMAANVESNYARWLNQKGAL